MPDYEHLCKSCNHEWEDTYSIKDEPPKVCPACKAENVIRLISLGGKGVVELTGQDLVNQIKSDAQKIKKDAAKDEKIYSNLIGESKYQELQTKMDNRRRR